MSATDTEEAAEAGARPSAEPNALVVLVRVSAWLAALPYVLVVLLVLTGPPTWSAVAYLAGMGLLVYGLMTLPSTHTAPRLFGLRRPRGLTRGAVLAIVAVGLVRLGTARSGETLHFSPDARLVDRLFDESDLAVSGARVLFGSGILQDDAREAPDAMRVAYDRMRAAEGDAPSPVVATYLGLQRPSAFDLVVIEPSGPSEAHDAILFLHGTGGNFALPCWQMARAVAPLGMITACPSTHSAGYWEGPSGELIVKSAIETLRARGVSRIVLAGLSNGGYGASALAPRMPGEFVALVLISGERVGVPAAGIPTLVLHGKKDTMVDFAEAEMYTRRTGARLVVLDAGHFAMLVRAEEHDDAVRTFLRAVLASPSGS